MNKERSTSDTGVSHKIEGGTIGKSVETEKEKT